MRKGNNQKHEQTLQIGVVGIDAAAEGPFKQGGKSSYLFNYRYSTLGFVAPLLSDNAGGINYQDLSFKLNFPTKKTGVFSIWGLGLIDRVAATAKQDVVEWVYDDDRENHDIKQYTGATGISHNLYFNRKHQLSFTLASTFNGVNYPVDRLDSSGYVNPKSLLNNKYHHLVLSSSLNTKFNAKHSNKTGFTLTHMRYNVLLQNEFGISSAKKYVVNEMGNSSMIAAYTTSTLQLSGRTIVNAGINAQLFTLNNTYRIEPRLGINHQISNKHTLAFAYGLHSRLERLNYYFIKNSAAQHVNTKISPTKAHHLVLGYDINTSTFTNLKIETYYQYLFDVPVIANSSFSMLNLQNDWFLSAALQNKGKGENYGIEFTFDKYLSKGYYYMANASLFRSIYQGG
ncbi:MAG: prevent-host-death protein, partial [Sphingobacteriaceae bacterium]